MSRRAEQVIAPKRETATFLFSLRVKFYVVAGGFALGELWRSMACLLKYEWMQLKR
jgi:hypothetical protein